ncbi:MAG: porin [Rhodobacteraceae bacterium]|nr:porin [Paracoccaceae bacterium]
MKKLLIASTALVMVAGAAAADVKLTGDARFGLTYNSSFANDSFIADYRARATITMTGKTDSGLDFGAKFRVDQAGGAAAGAYGTAWIGGSWGRVTVGAVDVGDDSVGLGIADVGHRGIGLDDDAESLFAGTNANIAYTGTFGAISVALSYDLPTSDGDAVQGDWALGVGYKAGDYKVALGYDSNEVLTVGGGATFGAVSVNAIYSNDNANNVAAWGVDASYKLNSATTITAVYGDDDSIGAVADYGVGVAYNLGGGAKLMAGIGSVDDDTIGSVGMTFSF